MALYGAKFIIIYISDYTKICCHCSEKRNVCIILIICLHVFLVIQALVALVNEPEPEHPLRADLAEEYLKDRKKFSKNAEEFTKKYSEKRPSD